MTKYFQAPDINITTRGNQKEQEKEQEPSRSFSCSFWFNLVVIFYLYHATKNQSAINMKKKWTPFLIWVMAISLIGGMIIPALLVAALLLFNYMYNALHDDAKRRERDKAFNEYLREKGRLN